jgi:hypothetical protein
VGDEVHRVVARHVLLLQEVGGVRLAFGEDGDEDVGARDLGAARGLDVDRGALDHPLEGGGGHGLAPVDVGDQGGQVVVDEVLEVLAKLAEVHRAGAHDAGRVGLVDEGEEEVLQGGELVAAPVGEREGRMDGLLESGRERRHGACSSGAAGGTGSTRAHHGPSLVKHRCSGAGFKPNRRAGRSRWA